MFISRTLAFTCLHAGLVLGAAVHTPAPILSTSSTSSPTCWPVTVLPPSTLPGSTVTTSPHNPSVTSITCRAPPPTAPYPPPTTTSTPIAITDPPPITGTPTTSSTNFPTMSCWVTTITTVPTATGSVPMYSQCDGIGWTGSTQCKQGYQCIKMNEWYSQCFGIPVTQTLTVCT
ncbi:hypothetical protein CPB83DRAFT_846392 [Crepidotus variabilis]|uniref:CBM1 domain-containing protein n=1 Tax=Crepidotus variabilis TaxID=179855 RepID=A0A9P6JTU9_9AGAR|nr:hypothetical protein CPB83DRAFT_846392 [Crepidotus variabilis]